jgi:integrase/recombinase XerD
MCKTKESTECHTKPQNVVPMLYQLKVLSMATVKIVLRSKKNKDDTYPLAIRITQDRKTSYIHLGYHVKAFQWDATQQRVKKNYPSAARLNNYLVRKLAEATNTSLELETLQADFSSEAIKQKIKPIGGVTFFTQAEAYLETLRKEGKFNRYSPDRSRLKQFNAFLNNRDIAFSDITIPLLDRFQTYLKSEVRASNRTIANFLMVIRAVFSQAVEQKIVDAKYYPFGKGKIAIKFPESNKVGLNKNEVERLETLDLSSNLRLMHARDLWLFSFYFAGMRVSDVLRLTWSDFHDERLFYTMGKNEKAGSLKIPAKAASILEKYKRPHPLHNLVFPELECLHSLKDRFIVEKKINEKVKLLDERLREVVAEAGIHKKLTMHIARHTFGNISGDRIPIQMLQKLYRHSSITTTVIYQSNFMHKEADEALSAVIGN